MKMKKPSKMSIQMNLREQSEQSIILLNCSPYGLLIWKSGLLIWKSDFVYQQTLIWSFTLWYAPQKIKFYIKKSAWTEKK